MTTLRHSTNSPVLVAPAEVKAWVIWFARLGYTAKATVFLVLGLLAVEATFARGGKLSDQLGALQAIGQSPFGSLLLSILALGLGSHALWQILLALLDLEHKGRTVQGLLLRAGFGISGLIYSGLAGAAVRILLGLHNQSGEQRAEALTAQVLAHPLGSWLVGIFGSVVAGLGLYQFYKLRRSRFLGDLRLDVMSRPAQRWVCESGRLGHTALGTVMLLVGSFLIQAAIQLNPHDAGGVQQALQTLGNQPYGVWLLAAMALGLMAYGSFTLMLARYANCLFVYCADAAGR